MRSLVPGCPDYPRLLAAIPAPPDPLHVQGGLLPCDERAVAIVGTRTPTPYGAATAGRLAGELAACGFTVVSGLARGIDAAAHSSALEAGGRTIAVLGCGLDVDYPAGGRALRERIVSSGALVSEFEAGTPPLGFRFPLRNRIISGLSLGVVVVEAGERSGSLITARWALDQGREVMAVPGRVDCPVSSGTFALLRDGAAPVARAADILENLGIASPPRPSGGQDGLVSPVLAALAFRPSRAEEISRAAGLALEEVLGELSRLEVAGLVRRTPGGYYAPSTSTLRRNP